MKKFMLVLATSIALFFIGNGVASAHTTPPPKQGDTKWQQSKTPENSTDKHSPPYSSTPPPAPSKSSYTPTSTVKSSSAPTSKLAPSTKAGPPPVAPLAPTSPLQKALIPGPLCSSKSTPPTVNSKPSSPVQPAKVTTTTKTSVAVPVAVSSLPITKAATGSQTPASGIGSGVQLTPPVVVAVVLPVTVPKPEVAVAAPAPVMPALGWPTVGGSLANTGSDIGVLSSVALGLLLLGVTLLIITASKPRNHVIFTPPEITKSEN